MKVLAQQQIFKVRISTLCFSFTEKWTTSTRNLTASRWPFRQASARAPLLVYRHITNIINNQITKSQIDSKRADRQTDRQTDR